jgi:release factor glutamine methyltransferase
MSTIQEVFSSGIKKLICFNNRNPQLDAKILLRHILGINNEKFELKKNDEISFVDLDNYFKLISRRLNGEPIAYIIGKQSFWNDDFKVTKDTLIPRPETELIIENIIKYFPEKNAKLRFADLGTGSGCIIISLLQEYINATGVGIDISEQAIKIATQNKKLLSKPERLDFIINDFSNFNLNDFDIIVANPPYVNIEDNNLDRNVYEHEPHLALFAKKNGLSAYEIILNNAFTIKSNNLYLFLEIGINQANSVSKLLKNNNFKVISIENDLANIPRCIIAKKNNKLELD